MVLKKEHEAPSTAVRHRLEDPTREEKEPKGFCWVNLARGCTTWQFVEVAARRFLTVRVDAREAEDPTTAVLEAMAAQEIVGAVVRVIVTLRADQELMFDEREVRAALAGAYYVAAMKKDVERPDRIRLGNRPAEGLSPRQLLELVNELLEKSAV